MEKSLSFNRSQQGVTLIELAIVVAILAIVSSVAVPAFSHFFERQRISNQVNTIYSTLMLAQSEAYKMNTTVRLYPSSLSVDTDLADIQCATSIANKVDWSKGWILWADKDLGGYKDVDGEAEILRVFQAEEGVEVIWNNNVQPQYKANGLGAQAGSFFICSESGLYDKRLVVNVVGRPYVVDHPDGCTND